MGDYVGRKANEDDIVEVAQWATKTQNERTAFVHSLINYTRVPYTRVVVVSRGRELVALALIWLKHSAVTQRITAEVTDIILKSPSDEQAFATLVSTCESVVKNTGASELEVSVPGIYLEPLGYKAHKQVWVKGV
ncbi:N-acetyltransferase [Coprothermobacteraceae bacterium]|nr:N-acetyltransferase [Coprothermobacteraceae bacterium]